jgi:hypothetical protein
VRYLLHQSTVWWGRALDSPAMPGPKAYALRQAATWHGHAVAAETLFKLVNPAYITLVT